MCFWLPDQLPQEHSYLSVGIYVWIICSLCSLFCQNCHYCRYQRIYPCQTYKRPLLASILHHFFCLNLILHHLVEQTKPILFWCVEDGIKQLKSHCWPSVNISNSFHLLMFAIMLSHSKRAWPMLNTQKCTKTTLITNSWISFLERCIYSSDTVPVKPISNFLYTIIKFIA